jgi:TetR/AcrR family transcriptional repressor of nem operon
MRYPEGHNEAVRSKIVDAAAKAIRGHGIGGVSIPKLMKRVGLTHGGFYVHFKDKDELVAAAVLEAAERTGQRVFRDQPSLEASLRLYLSEQHLEEPTTGCVVAALGTDAPRQAAPVRRAFAEAARGLLFLLEKKLHPDSRKGHLSDDTLLRGASMIGALVLGRAVGDESLARRILAVARAA